MILGTQPTVRDLRPLRGPRLVVMAHAEAENGGLRPLSDLGRLQSARAAENLARWVQAPTSIVSSPLLRATETAEIVSRTLAERPLPVRLEPRLALGQQAGHAELIRIAMDFARSSEPLLVVTCPLEVELIVCGMCNSPGRRRSPTESTLPRGLAPATIVTLALREGHWRIANVLDHRLAP